MPIDYDDPKMEGYVPLQDYIDQDGDHSSRRIRDTSFGRKKEDLQISVDSLTFPDTGMGYESPTQVIVLTNVGYDDVHIYGTTLKGDFILKTEVPSLLKAGEVASVQIAFAPPYPGSIGPKSGSIYFDTGNAAGDELVELAGEAVIGAPEVSPQTIQDLIFDATEEARGYRDESLGFKEEIEGYIPINAGHASTATSQANRAEEEADRAEGARDAAFLNANVYPSTSAGISATTDGQQFRVVEGDVIQGYTNVSGTATPITGAVYPTYLGVVNAVAQARRQFELDADSLYKPAIYTNNFKAIPVYHSVMLDMETATGDGTLFYAVYPEGVVEPDRLQIESGVGGDGSASVMFGSATVGSIDSMFQMPRSLDGATDYEVWAFQRSAEGLSSIRHQASFTTPLIIASAAYDGTTTGLTAQTGASLVANQPDAGLGLTAVRVQDVNDGAMAGVQALVVVNLIDGVNFINAKVKKVSGTFDALSIGIGNMTQGYSLYIDVATGAVSNLFPIPPIVTPIGGGWYDVRIEVDVSGWADRNGVIRINMRQGTGTSVLRNGTQKFDVNDIFVSEE